MASESHMSIKIVTDSTSDMPTDIARALSVTVVPGYIRFGFDNYRDGIDISNEAFYQKLVNSPFHPTTSEPTPEDFATVYSGFTQESEGIVSIHVSSKISKTYNSAMKAKKHLKRQCQIEVVDSRLVSIGLSLVVMKAASLAEAGESMQNILEEINTDVRKIRMLGVLNTMKYLIKGGRAIGAKASLSHMFDIKPVLTFRDGEIVQEGIVHTESYSRMMDRLYEFVQTNSTIQDLVIAHSAIPDQAEELKERLSNAFPKEKIQIAQLGAAIGAHGGPGALIVALRQHM
jgi:DegV family protein with EDD domain